MQVLKNNIMTTVGELDQAIGASRTVAQTILAVAEAVRGAAPELITFAKAVAVAGAAYVGAMVGMRAGVIVAAVAEYFRDQGKSVMLMFDSVTRYAKAQREIGLAIGEPPATRGYTPSVFENLPKLLERSGTSDKGSITGFYTVLVDGDDMDEPISDAVRGILDGHVILSRRLAQQYHYPAIDVLASVSRLSNRVSGATTKKAAGYIRRLMAVHRESEDMINVGAYQKGSNPAIDEAIAHRDKIEDFLTQEVSDRAPIEQTLKAMGAVADMEIPEEELGLHGPGAKHKYDPSSIVSDKYDQSDWQE